MRRGGGVEKLADVNGCSQFVNRAPTWLNSLLATYAPKTNSRMPISSQEVRWVAM